MESQPVYFKGGTFGSGGASGWWIAIIAAVVTAIGTWGAGQLIECYKRHRDRVTLAASFRSDMRGWPMKVSTASRKRAEPCGSALRR